MSGDSIVLFFFVFPGELSGIIPRRNAKPKEFSFAFLLGSLSGNSETNILFSLDSPVTGSRGTAHSRTLISLIDVSVVCVSAALAPLS